MVAYLDELIDEIGNDQKHPLASLMETNGALIESYERKSVNIPKKGPVSILKSIMTEHNLKQKDMKKIGSQGVVSDTLNGRRILNIRQIQALAQRFSSHLYSSFASFTLSLKPIISINSNSFNCLLP